MKRQRTVVTGPMSTWLSIGQCRFGIIMVSFAVVSVVYHHHVPIVVSFSSTCWLKQPSYRRNKCAPTKNKYCQQLSFLEGESVRLLFPNQQIIAMTKRRRHNIYVNYYYYHKNRDYTREYYDRRISFIQANMHQDDCNPKYNQFGLTNRDERYSNMFRVIKSLMHPIRTRKRQTETNSTLQPNKKSSHINNRNESYIITEDGAATTGNDENVQVVQELLIPYRLGLYPYMEKESSSSTRMQSRKQQSIRNNNKGIIESIFGTKSQSIRLFQPFRSGPKLSTTKVTSESIKSLEIEDYDLLNVSKIQSFATTSNTTSQSTDVLSQDNNFTLNEDMFWKIGNETIETALNVLSSLPFGTVILTGGNATALNNNTISLPVQLISNYSNYTTEFANFIKPFIDMIYTNTNITSSTNISPRNRPNVQMENRYNALVTGIETLLQTKNPNDVLTVGDLQLILRESVGFNSGVHYENKIKKQQHLQQPTPILIKRINFDDNKKHNELVGGGPTSTKSSSSSKSDKSFVAFPQPSVLSYRALTYGCVASGCTFGIIAGMSILPNLWLVGALLGSIYGYETGKNYAKIGSTTEAGDTSTDTKLNQNLIQAMIVLLGRRIALNYLLLYDYWQYLFFMYKTGQLSYEYYKTYATLDSKFAIQAKIDAWNARFAEGKVAFDQWEKENEIGRKVLATLRTIWLVEERSLKKQNRLQNKFKSKYRLVQFVYDTLYSIQRLLKETWISITTRNEIRYQEIKEFWKGIFVKVDRETIRARINSSITAALVVALTGSLFTIFPQVMIAISVIVGGIIWPSWFTEFYSRCNGYLDEIRARGRGENVVRSVYTKNTSRKRVPYNPNLFMQLLDSTNPTSSSNDKLIRYHDYRKPDGTKRYYRVGEPWFGRKLHVRESVRNNKNNKYAPVDTFRWPWEQKKGRWNWFRS